MKFHEIQGSYVGDPIHINEPGIFCDIDLAKGAGYTGRYDVVANAWICAPGKGEEAIIKIGERLQDISDGQQKTVLHIEEVERNSPQGNALFRKMRDKGLYGDVWFGDRRYFVREFKPR